jgi:hypothetical protein
METALQDFSRVIAIDPENSEALNNLALVFLKKVANLIFFF